MSSAGQLTASFVTSQIDPSATESVVYTLEDRRGRFGPAELHDPTPDMGSVLVHERAVWITEE